MRTGLVLVLVLAALLLETSFVGSTEDKTVQVERSNSTEFGDRKKNVSVTIEEKRDPSLESRLCLTNEKTVNVTSDICNVSTKDYGPNTYLNVTNYNLSLAMGMNISGDFFKDNYTLENLYNDTDLMDSTEYFTESVTEYYDLKKFERRSDDFGDITLIDEDKPLRTISPKIDKDMVKIAFKGVQASKIKGIMEKHDPKKFQQRTFDIMGMLGFNNNNKHNGVVKITKEVAVPVPYTVEKKIPVPVRVEVDHPIPVQVPKAYPVTIEKKVYYPVKEYIPAPYPVYKKVPYLVKIAVEKPVPVHIEKPYPVYIERKIPYPVEKQIHYPVKIPVDRPVPVKVPVVKNVYYPVEKKVVYPVPVPVEKPVPVPVEKPYPVYVEKTVPVPVETHVPYTIPVEEPKPSESTSNHNVEHEFKGYNFTPSEQIKTDLQNEYGKTGGFSPIIVENHNPTRLQDKKDEDLTLEEPKKTVTTTEKPSIELESQRKSGEKSQEKEKEVQEFGRKIKKT